MSLALSATVMREFGVFYDDFNVLVIRHEQTVLIIVKVTSTDGQMASIETDASPVLVRNLGPRELDVFDHRLGPRG